MNEIRKNPLSRGAKFAAIPLGIAGRGARSLGQKLAGRRSNEAVAADQERAAADLFRVLGELKGGAMKFGQALSVLEAALPEEAMAPYRDSLRKLQDSAPAMDFPAVQQQLATELGPQWRESFAEFDEEPVAAASLGQVHKATLPSGEPVAVKIQYPGADEAFRGDLATISRFGKLAGGALPGVDMAPLVAELRSRAEEELDYTLEAESQRRCFEAFADSDRIVVPEVFQCTQRVLVTSWLPGRPMVDIINNGSSSDRDVLSRLYLEFLLLSPERAGLLHADPHPGNFRLTEDGRLGVLDFGAVKHLPDGMPRAIGRLMWLAKHHEAAGVEAGLREEGFVRAALPVDPDDLLEYLDPFLEPLRVAEFTFTRDWMAELFQHVKDPSRPQWAMGMKLNLPAEYLLIHRVWSGGVGMLCQLGGTVPVIDVFTELLPEFGE